MQQAPEKILKLVDPVVTGLGYEFVGAELLGSPKEGLLRVFIDSEKGVDIDDCAVVSRQLGGVLDVEDPIAGNYQLEVSSPGLDRPLFTLLQFSRFVGQKVSVKLNFPLLGRRNFKGILSGIDENKVIVEVDGELYEIPFQMIMKANLMPDISFKR